MHTKRDSDDGALSQRAYNNNATNVYDDDDDDDVDQNATNLPFFHLRTRIQSNTHTHTNI